MGLQLLCSCQWSFCAHVSGEENYIVGLALRTCLVDVNRIRGCSLCSFLWTSQLHCWVGSEDMVFGLGPNVGL